MHKLLIYLILPFSILLTSARQAPHPDKGVKPKNIILVIVDGAGVPEWSAAAVANGGNLQMGKFPQMGLMKTWGNDNLTPDAYANATAIATGQKTLDGILSMDSRGVRSRTLAEYARDRKMLTALISVSSVTSPSAAAFFAHEDIGVNDEKIAKDIARFKPDILIGGGAKYFNARSDNALLSDSFRVKGYDMITKEKRAEKFTSMKAYGLVSEDEMQPVTRRGNFLSEVSVSAVRNMASYFEGYFMIIHSAQLELAFKSNTPTYMTEELKDINKTVGALYQQAPNMDETLVVVLSPGELGGFIFKEGSLKTGGVSGSWPLQKNSATMVPVFASGPGAEKFAGIYDNTELFTKILSLMR